MQSFIGLFEIIFSKMVFEMIIITCLIVVIIFARHYKIRKQSPPGPVGFPFLGILPMSIIQHLLANNFPKVPERIFYAQMKAKYGDVWSFEIFNKKIIVLASLEALNETIVNKGKLFSGRPLNESFKVISENCGIIFISGTLWNENRQLAIRALRDLGMGKRNLIDDICDESNELIDYIEKNLSSSFTSPDLFVKPSSNVINKLVFNERNNYDDSEDTGFFKNIKSFMSSHTAQTLIDFFPNLYKLKIFRKMFPAIDQFQDSCKECLTFIANKCRSRIKFEKEFSKPICVFDYFWRYRYQDHQGVDRDEIFRNISHSMLDLYNAGIDTVTNTIGFSCLILGQNQTLQNELRKEVCSLVDDFKCINMEMKKDCPLLLSFIDEIQRFCYLVPFVYHRTSEPYVYRDYKIETSDIILGDLVSISRDPKHFENPDTFDPYRFLDKTRTKYIPNKLFIPFGIGKRTCLGESIAITELFMFLSKMIYKFEISLAQKTQDNFDEILKGKFGVVHVPLQHEIIFKNNKSK